MSQWFYLKILQCDQLNLQQHKNAPALGSALSLHVLKKPRNNLGYSCLVWSRSLRGWCSSRYGPTLLSRSRLQGLRHGSHVLWGQVGDPPWGDGRLEGGLRDGHQGGGEARLCTVNSFTQINPWDGKNLGRESVRKQVEGCLSRLQVLSDVLIAKGSKP